MGTTFANRQITAATKILSAADYRPFADARFDLAAVLEKYGPSYIEAAEKELENPYPLLNATQYMEFAREGNRSRFEAVYFRRRSMLMTFVLAELAEKKNRFTDRIIDGVWHILEESTWILPAHNATNKNNPGTPLIDAFFTAEEDDDVKHIDLFAATTAAQMAWIWYLTEDILDPHTPVIRRRILSQLKQRILHPFRTYKHDWWMGYKGGSLNNWTPWIISNVLTVLSLCEEDTAVREEVVEKSITILDFFTRDYPSDGGCDEGPGYWGAAGASYFDCMELLYDLSGGKIDIFDDELAGKMCEYIMNFCISRGTYINFADAASHINPDARLIHRMGRRFGNDRLCAFASNLAYPENTVGINTSQMYRFFKNLHENMPAPMDFVPHAKLWYDGLQVAITNDADSGLFLALKGGCNGESHNHNDVGQFILFDRGEPVILDAGVEQYCRDTFSSRRYTLWAMRSSYHNIPEISGVEQKPGKNFRAEVVSYDEATGALTLELKNAYPAEANIESYRRTASLANGVVTVRDEIRLTKPGTVDFHYITLDKPEFADGEVRFASGHVARFDGKLTPSADEIDLKNGKISREWRRESLWRVNLTAKEEINEAAFVMTISK